MKYKRFKMSNSSIDMGDTGIKFSKVLKYSSTDEVSRIRHKLQVVKEGEVIVGVVGMSHEHNLAYIGPLAVDKKFQVKKGSDECLKTNILSGSGTGRLDNGSNRGQTSSDQPRHSELQD